MKVRMIFGTIVEQGGQRTDLRTDSEHDLPSILAADLISQGRAEALEAPAKAKKGTKE